jgi:vacuolar-type H+-ATPase subunit H
MDLDRAKSTNAGSGIVQDPNRLNPQVEAKTQPQAASDIVTESTEAASDIIRDVKNVSGEIIEHAKTAADGVIDQVQQAASEALTSSLQDLGTQARKWPATQASTQQQRLKTYTSMAASTCLARPVISRSRLY